MPYIKYPQVEELLKSYPLLKALLANLQREYRTVYEADVDWLGAEFEVMYSKIVGNHVLTDIPFGGHKSPGDKETGIISDAPGKEHKSAMRDIMADINLVWNVVDQMDNAFKCLTDDEQELIRDFYWQKRTIKQLRDKFHIGNSQVRRNKREAIEKMVKVLRITFGQYEFCKKQIEDEKESEEL